MTASGSSKAAGFASSDLKLSLREREVVLKQGRRKVLNRGQTLFSQGARHDGIWLVESGRVRVFRSKALPAGARGGPEAGTPQGAQSRTDAVQPGRQA